MVVIAAVADYIPGMSRYPHPRIGGDPALDFLNTVHDWTVQPRVDRLTDYPAAVGFAEAAGLVSAAEARRLAGVPAGTEVARLRELRAVLERVFRAVAEGGTPGDADLDQLAREAAAAAGAARLRGVRRGVERRITVERDGARTLRWRIVEAALALLTSPRLARVKACPQCGWFFRDASKNGSRRWCSMAMCGSVVKARRYYRRNRR